MTVKEYLKFLPMVFLTFIYFLINSLLAKVLLNSNPF